MTSTSSHDELSRLKLLRDENEVLRKALRDCISYRNWQIAEGGVVPSELADVWKRAEAALSKAGGQANEQA